MIAEAPSGMYFGVKDEFIQRFVYKCYEFLQRYKNIVLE